MSTESLSTRAISLSVEAAFHSKQQQVLSDPVALHIGWAVTANVDLYASIKERANMPEQVFLRVMPHIRPRTKGHAHASFPDQSNQLGTLSSIQAMIATISASPADALCHLTDMLVGVLLRHVAMAREFEAVGSGAEVQFFEQSGWAVVLVRVQTEADDHAFVGQRGYVMLMADSTGTSRSMHMIH